jgi:hypothetical protein
MDSRELRILADWASYRLQTSCGCADCEATRSQVIAALRTYADEKDAAEVSLSGVYNSAPPREDPHDTP